MPGGSRGLQNRRGGESSLAGSIPVRLRQALSLMGCGAISLRGVGTVARVRTAETTRDQISANRAVGLPLLAGHLEKR